MSRGSTWCTFSAASLTDTVSLARLGARSVTGLDFSAPALVAAAELAATAGVNIDFVESELYRAVEAVGPSRFDLVYTGIGALCILPDGRRRPRRPELVSMPSIRMVVPVEVAATLRDQRLVDAAGERLVFRARLGDDAVSAVLAASEDDLEELLGYVAAEANHEKDRRRDKRLDQAFEALKDVVDRP